MTTTKSLGAAVARARANVVLGVILPILMIWAYRPLVSEAIEETRAEPEDEEDGAQTPVCARPGRQADAEED